MANEFSNITDRQEFLEKIKMDCGMPMVNVEMTDESFYNAITDAALEFARYNNMDATFQEYCILNLSAGTQFYPVSACKSIIENGAPVTNVQSVTNIEISSSLDGINNLFTPAHILLVETGAMMMPNGSKFGPIINNVGAGNPLANYTEAIMYLKDITRTFGHSLAINYISGKKLLQTVPTPTTGGPCIVQLMRSINENEMYNFPSFRKLALARCLLIYARIVGKYTGSLPDNLQLNADSIRQEAKELYTEAIAEIKSESAPCDFFVY